MGIRQKIMLGFAALGFLLLMSGVISYSELNLFTRLNTTIVEQNNDAIDLTVEILDLLEEQNKHLVWSLLHGGDEALELSRNKQEMDEAFLKFRRMYDDVSVADSAIVAKDNYFRLIQNAADSSHIDRGRWYLDECQPAHQELLRNVQNLIQFSNAYAEEESYMLENNVYWAIMPAVIALGVAVLILLMLFYMIDLYFIRPVVKMSRALDNYLKLKIPFKVTTEARDEVADLKEGIDELIDTIKANKSK